LVKAKTGTSNPVGWASNFNKFHLVIPATEYIKTFLFAISGDDPKYIYGLLNSTTLHAFPIDIDGKSAIFTKTAMITMILEMGAGII